MNDEELRDAATATRRGVTRLSRRLRGERSAGALSANKVGVLGHLHRHGPATPGEIAAAEHQLPQSLSRVFAELTAAGLVSRSRSDRDRRESELHLTPQGHAALVQDMAERDAWLVAALRTLTPAEIRVLRVAGNLMDQLAEVAA